MEFFHSYLFVTFVVMTVDQIVGRDDGCTLCNKLYIGETGRRLGDQFREHLRDVEKNDKDASKPVARHFNLACA